MAYERKTVKIENPDIEGDFIVIAEADYNASAHHLYQPPAADFTHNPQPDAYPDAALVAEALDLPVSRLGPWLIKQQSPDMLGRLLKLEKRSSAKPLIEQRIRGIWNSVAN